jgi:hypothetical protein
MTEMINQSMGIEEMERGILILQMRCRSYLRSSPYLKMNWQSSSSFAAASCTGGGTEGLPMKEAGCVELEFIFTLLSQIAAVALPMRCMGWVSEDTVRKDEAVASAKSEVYSPRDAG